VSNAIYVFTNDLRLSDNASLRLAVSREQQLDFIYCFDPRWLKPTNYFRKPLGAYRYRFLQQSLDCLTQRLAQHGQRLNVFFAPLERVVEKLYTHYGVTRVYHSVNAGWYEQRGFERLQQQHEGLNCTATHTHTLFDPNSLPIAITDLPATFSKFRKKVEHARHSIAKPDHDYGHNPEHNPEHIPVHFSTPALPKMDWLGALPQATLPDAAPDRSLEFQGGEVCAQQHLHTYFSTDRASSYKITRNALDDFSSSTKFSPWLANGSLSARQVLQALNDYEQERGENDSTYWIFFELLWREYFQWYAHCHQTKLFALSGIGGEKPLATFYQERYQSWCQGNTPYPIVNACMRQLNQTGYLSNRGRQLVASCFVNELELDWRYGAAYFEEKLIDYDVAANWGNWQYLAGVGADPRGKRHYNLEKQTQTYDPQGDFIKQWQGASTPNQSIDSVDAVGWPIMPSDVSGADTSSQSPNPPFKVSR
jgi:deoxyribodipyrimidine photo-lyase